jgi:serine/threonine protein kinase
MGSVYLAQDTRLPRQWALKEMTDQFTDPAERAEAESAFLAEAAILAGLNHPNLPRVVDFFQDQGRNFLVMDFVAGTTLEKRLQQGPLGVQEALQLGVQIAQVLDYLHSQSHPVIFRDLKPANIILTPEGRPTLVDFGIARLFRQGAGSDTRALGTPGYAAPEQYGRGQSDHRTDIYALGATLHHCLSGRDPAESPFSFQPLTGAVPADLDRVVTRALQLKPEDRFASAADMAQALLAVERDLGRSGALPSSSKTSELTPSAAPPATTMTGTLIPGFHPGNLELGKVDWGGRLRTSVVLQGQAKGKLSSDCKWLKVEPSKVNGENVALSIYADSRKLDEGGKVAGLIHLKGEPSLPPLRVELEVLPRKTPAWCWPSAIFLIFWSLLPLVGLVTTPLMFGTAWSAPQRSRSGLSFLAWTSAFLSLSWVSVIGLCVGILHLDWKALLHKFGL